MKKPELSKPMIEDFYNAVQELYLPEKEENFKRVGRVLEKAIPLEPDWEEENGHYRCPKCGHPVAEYGIADQANLYGSTYCSHCGQMIFWDKVFAEEDLSFEDLTFADFVAK